MGNLKKSSWLVLEIMPFFFRDKQKEKAAFIEVKILGTTSMENKNMVTASICALFENKLGITKDNIYITFAEVTDWGWNGSLF